MENYYFSYYDVKQELPVAMHTGVIFYRLY